MFLYTSDLHLFHENIIKLCNRPFKNIEEMHETIKNNWNNKVKVDDTVIIGGDIGFPKDRKNIDAVVQFIDSLNGEKILVIGNHDGKLLKNQKFRDCFISINQYLEINDNDKKVIIFHYPIEEWNGYFRNTIHLFGHVHNNENNLQKIKNRYNIGVDVNNFIPMTLNELIKK